eukprot:588360_1
MMMRLLFIIPLIVLISADSRTTNSHNNARRAAGVNTKLRWSRTFEASAKQVSKWLCSTGKWEHSKVCSGSGGCRPRVSENIAGHGNLAGATSGWLAEKKYYKNGRCQSGKVCGHYTNIINRNTKSFGCYASKNCKKPPVGRTVCHYSSNANGFEADVPGEWECGESEYVGDVCLYSNGDAAEPMRFAISQSNGCGFEEKVYEHIDSDHNKHYLHFVMDYDANGTVTDRRWLVSRDYVSDIATFWCDSWSLMECEQGKWNTNVFEEDGVLAEIELEITINKCPLKESQEAKDAQTPIIIMVLCIAAVVVLVATIAFIYRRKKSKKIQHFELKEDEIEVDVDGSEQTTKINA